MAWPTDLIPLLMHTTDFISSTIRGYSIMIMLMLMNKVLLSSRSASKMTVSHLKTELNQTESVTNVIMPKRNITHSLAISSVHCISFASLAKSQENNLN